MRFHLHLLRLIAKCHAAVESQVFGRRSPTPYKFGITQTTTPRASGISGTCLRVSHSPSLT